MSAHIQSEDGVNEGHSPMHDSMHFVPSSSSLTSIDSELVKSVEFSVVLGKLFD